MDIYNLISFAGIFVLISGVALGGSPVKTLMRSDDPLLDLGIRAGGAVVGPAQQVHLLDEQQSQVGHGQRSFSGHANHMFESLVIWRSVPDSDTFSKALPVCVVFGR
jgi:hypothetical protein